ncbi:hypothetical protein N0V82_007965 [Gnomoniopsis sp. IMI 355080]|nr:hypothetical protein N0V82_007965 [Gnomoniopsis sp. IMI 355080]
MWSLPFLSLFAASSFATKLLLPLYQYPEGTAWDPVYSAIEANPQLIFQIVINPDSGPAGSVPDSNFVTGTSKLNSYSNVETLGYVHCSYGADQEGVDQNVTDWAAWNSYSGANVSISGIFFDETPNTEGGSDDVSFVQTAVEAASTAFGSHQFTSMLNPGAAVEHDEFWELADYIVIFEAEASEYSDSVLTTNIPSGKASQSSILIYDFASVGSASLADTWLQTMMEADVGSAHILNYDYIEATTAESPASIGSIAIVLAVSVNSGASSSVTTSATTIAPTSSTVAPSETESTSSTTLVTSRTKKPSSTRASEPSILSSPDSEETASTSSTGLTATVYGTTSTPSPTGRHQHAHGCGSNNRA